MLAMAVKTMLLSLLGKVVEPQAAKLTDYVANKVSKRFEAEKEPIASKQDILELQIAVSQLQDEQVKSSKELLKWVIILAIPVYVGLIVLLVKAFTS